VYVCLYMVCTRVIYVCILYVILYVCKYVFRYAYISTYVCIGMSCAPATRPPQRLKDHYANQVTLFFLLLCVCSNFGKRTAANARVSGRRCIMMVIAPQRRVLGVNEKLTFCTQIDTHYAVYVYVIIVLL